MVWKRSLGYPHVTISLEAMACNRFDRVEVPSASDPLTLKRREYKCPVYRGAVAQLQVEDHTTGV